MVFIPMVPVISFAIFVSWGHHGFVICCHTDGTTVAVLHILGMLRFFQSRAPVASVYREITPDPSISFPTEVELHDSTNSTKKQILPMFFRWERALSPRGSFHFSHCSNTERLCNSLAVGACTLPTAASVWLWSIWRLQALTADSPERQEPLIQVHHH